MSRAGRLVAPDHPNDTGCLVGFFDTAALAEAICDLLDDPTSRQRLGANARAFAQATYDLKRVCLPRQLDWVLDWVEALLGPVAA